MIRLSFVCALLCLSVAALAQTPPLKPVSQSLIKQSPSNQAANKQITSEHRGQAIKLLRRHAEQSLPVKVLVADYVQRRTTTLSKKPLRSSGSFLFVRKPSCVVFRAEKPRQSIVRLTKELYEVFRPRRKRLERFRLDGPDLSQGLFAAVGGDADRLLKDFDVAGLLVGEGQAKTPTKPSPVTSAIRLVPKSKAMRERLQELIVTFAVVAKDKAKPDVTLRSVAYRDHSGDLIEIELRNVRANPKHPPSVVFDVPKGTKVIEHRAGR
ncbi:MAG: hypothetical protein ACI89X_003375 [Planctomycetota bacterium]|jgi:hypothetical protein